MKIVHMIAFILLAVGGINWGLVGLGSLMGGSDWNVVHMLLGQWAMLEYLVYILVGLSAIYEVATHKKHCKMCGTGGTAM